MSEQVLDHPAALSDLMTDPPIAFRNTEVLHRLDARVTRPAAPNG